MAGKTTRANQKKQWNIENSRCSPKVVWFPLASVRMFLQPDYSSFAFDNILIVTESLMDFPSVIRRFFKGSI